MWHWSSEFAWHWTALLRIMLHPLLLIDSQKCSKICFSLNSIKMMPVNPNFIVYRWHTIFKVNTFISHQVNSHCCVSLSDSRVRLRVTRVTPAPAPSVQCGANPLCAVLSAQWRLSGHWQLRESHHPRLSRSLLPPSLAKLSPVCLSARKVVLIGFCFGLMTRVRYN